jgi:uncharacterized protein (TIGR02271 family)
LSSESIETTPDSEELLELREEELVAHKELREAGEIVVRTTIEEVPGRLELDAYSEEVEIEHQPIGQAVSERRQPWEEGDVLVVPVYEEQLVVTKRLVLKEQLRIRRVTTTERRLFEEPVLRERLVIEDPQGTGLVHEIHPTSETHGSEAADDDEPKSGLIENIVRKALE